MAFDIETIIGGIRHSRQSFLKHIEGLPEDQWDWKPYPECKSIRETIAHLIADDRATVHMLETGQFPDFGTIMEQETSPEKLLALLAESHEKLCAFVREKFAGTPLETQVPFFMGTMPLGMAILGISNEDSYHAGQVAFIRMACDPEWDYYKSVYGG